MRTSSWSLPGTASDAMPGNGRRPLLTILVLAVYVAASVLLGYLSLESSLRTPVWSLLVMFAAGLAAITLWKRRPFVAFIVVLVLLPVSFFCGSGAEAILVCAGLYGIGAQGHTGRAWTAFAPALASDLVAALALALRIRFGPPFLGLAPRVDIDAWPTDWFSGAGVAAVVVLVFTLFGVNVGHRRRELRALRERAEQLRRERDQEAHIAAALERERIAREMHDVIAHSLAVMIAVADGAQAAAVSRPEESRRAIGRVADTGRQALVEMRRLLHVVRDDGGTSLSASMPPGIEQLPALIQESRDAGLPIRLQQTGTLASDAVVGLTVYRIVQEALTNTLRHARGVRDVLVALSFMDDETSVLVEDRSDVAQPVTDPGKGLVGIRERAAFYDGQVEAGPRPGGGWRLLVRLRTEQR